MKKGGIRLSGQLNYILFCMIGLILLLAATGCVPKKTCMQHNETDLETLVRKGWDARVAGNWSVLYDLATEAFQASNERGAIGSKSNVTINEYSIRSIKLNENNTAKVVVDFKVLHMGIEFPFTLSETWVWEKGCKWALDLSINN